MSDLSGEILQLGIITFYFLLYKLNTCELRAVLTQQPLWSRAKGELPLTSHEMSPLLSAVATSGLCASFSDLK